MQKLMREINRNPDTRVRWGADRAAVAAAYELTDAERRAVTEVDVATLYRMGVHALLLRPFTIVNGVSEPDYLAALRSDRPA